VADELDDLLAAHAHLLATNAKLVEELAKVKAQRDRGDDDWEWSFLRVMWKYLEALQVPKELMAPAHALFLAKRSEIEQARRRRAGDRRTLKPSSETVPMAAAAALVTALAKHVDLPRALQVVSRKSGIDRKKLENFRDNCHRARLSPETLKGYTEVLATIQREQWSAQDITEASALVRGFVTRPPSNNT
jgi:hypothetical protein